MQSAIHTRRMAHTALQDALRRSGIPPDLVVLPMQDDHTQLLVVQPNLVRWVWDVTQGGCRAEIEFTTDFTGYVTGPDIYDVLANSSNFEADMFGFERGIGNRYEFTLPFDITESADLEAIADLPYNPPRKQRKVHFQCRGSLS